MNAPLIISHGLTQEEFFAKLFQPMGVDGIYARSGLYESVVRGVNRMIDQLRPPEAEILCFPPVMSKRQVERSGYLKSFPHLLGCVCCLHGAEADISSALDHAGDGDDWAAQTTSADLVLSPAACYPAYPIVATRGPVPQSGYVLDVSADCFRHEPSRDLDRMQSFRMREFVCIGASQQVVDFRRFWMDRAQAVVERLGLFHKVETASDPFFGRVGQLLAANQIEQALKFELLIPLRDNSKMTACMSFNYHRDHFGRTWEISLIDGSPAHTACVAFGVDRLAIALFSTYGVDLRLWPYGVLSMLEINVALQGESQK